MIVVEKGEFEGTRQELETEIAKYQAALDAHKDTRGVPAPWPSYDILRKLVRVSSDQWLLEEEVVPDEEEPRKKPKAPDKPRGNSVADLREEIAAMRQALIDAGVWVE